MGLPAPSTSSPGSTALPAAMPETLARLILRCRELTTFLEASRPHLPTRAETPFLHSQLDDELRRLQANLKLLQSEDTSSERVGFLRLLGGKKPREPRKSEPRYDLEGNSWTIPVTELVGFLSHSGKTGLLWVTSPNETFMLEFVRGSLVHATSNAPPAAFRLGEILVSEKLLGEGELARLIQDAKAADDLLGNHLVRSGRLPHSDLQRALSIQVQQLFHRLMDAENALFRFQEGACLQRGQGLEVNITQLLLESARKKDEERERAEPTRPAPAGLAVLEEGGEAEVEPPAALPSAELGGVETASVATATGETEPATPSATASEHSNAT